MRPPVDKGTISGDRKGRPYETATGGIPYIERAVEDAGPYTPFTDRLFVGGGVLDAPHGKRAGYGKRL